MTIKNAEFALTAQDRTSAAFASVERRLLGMQSAASAVTTVVGAVGTGAFVGFIKSTIDAADELNDLSQRTAISVSTLAGLKLASDQSGASLDNVARGVRALVKAQITAAEGDVRMAAALKQLGVTARDPEKAIIQLARAFEGLDDRAKVDVGEKLGKGINALIPLLNSGADGLEKIFEQSRQLNPDIERLAQQSDAFNDQLAIMQTAAGAAGNSIALDLLPHVTKLASGFTAARLSGTGFFTWLTTGGDEETNAAARINELAASIARMKKQRDELSKPTVANRINDVVFGDVKDLNVQIQAGEAKIAYLRKLKSTQDALVQSAPKPKAAFTFEDPAAEAKARAAAAAAAVTTRMNRQAIISAEERLQSAQKLSNVLQTTYDIESGKYRDLSASTKRRLLEIAQEIDANTANASVQKEQDALAKQRSEEGISRFKALQEAGTRVYESTRTDAEKYGDEVARLNDLLAQGAIDQKTFDLAVAQAGENMKRTAKDGFGQMTAAAIGFQTNVQRNLGDGLFRSLSGDFEGIGTMWKNMVLRMASDAIAANVSGALFGQNGSGGLLQEGLSMLGSLLGGFGGGKSLGGAKLGSSNFGQSLWPVPKFAGGGDFMGGLRLVGEQGPELEATGPSRIFNASQTKNILSGGGKSMTVSYSPVIHIDSRTDRNEVHAIVSRAVKQGNADLVDRLTRQGAI